MKKEDQITKDTEETPSRSACGAAPCSALWECPQCNNFGKIAMPTLSLDVECPLCEGTGMVHEWHPDWKAQGKEIKNRRIAAGYTLRTGAKLVQIDPSNLSKMERGLIKPQNIVYPVQSETKQGDHSRITPKHSQI